MLVELSQNSRKLCIEADEVLKFWRRSHLLSLMTFQFTSCHVFTFVLGIRLFQSKNTARPVLRVIGGKGAKITKILPSF